MFHIADMPLDQLTWNCYCATDVYAFLTAWI